MICIDVPVFDGGRGSLGRREHSEICSQDCFVLFIVNTELGEKGINESL